MTFDRPTLVTLTAPTCSGKSHLLNFLTSQGYFDRIVSTTTRPPRPGEKQGFDYDFISVERSKELEQQGSFFELVEFNNTRYGVTHAEMEGKMSSAVAPAIILEPQGVTIYEGECRKRGWDIFKVFVQVTESVRLDRLLQRTNKEAGGIIDKMSWTTPTSPIELAFRESTGGFSKKALEKVINEHHRRVLSITGPERSWLGTNSWDAIIPGDDVETAVAMLEAGVRWRNKKVAKPQAIGRVSLPSSLSLPTF
jgi:guanylate kinase